ncbi:uncharacterized protein [Dermacentor albipictus]|uniref:uncharacterized protein n=1 Tax=Dermacentor albipictus TaxID=60249 RepID=UPI0038FCDC21
MTSAGEERCSVYLRISLGCEKECGCAKGHVFTVSAHTGDVAMDVRWSIVFVFDEALRLRYEAFHKNGAVLMSLCYVPAFEMERWRREGGLVKICEMILPSGDVFKAFTKIAPQGEVEREARTYNSWVVTLLKELKIHVPIDVQCIAGLRFKAMNAAMSEEFLKEVIKDLRFVFKDNGINAEPQKPCATDVQSESSDETIKGVATISKGKSTAQCRNERHDSSQLAVLPRENQDLPFRPC